MGKAAIQRKNRRKKYLAKLAISDPDKFEIEWDLRVSSWMDLIRRTAGRLVDKNGKALSSVFKYVDEAMEILAFCDEKTAKKYGKHTFDLLVTECCRQFADRSNPQLFRPNNYDRLEYHAHFVLEKTSDASKRH